MRSVVALASLVLLAGCRMDRRYVSPEGGTLWQLALTPDTPPFLESLFIVERRVELPVRAPTPDQLAQLDDDPRGLGPYPRRPWVERGDYEIEIDFTLYNLDAERRLVTLTINGFNEFHEYVPGARIEDNDLVIDFAGWERAYLLEPHGRLSGTIREEEMDEIAVDLATVVNGAPNSNQVVYFQNQSAHDARSQMFIPPIVPALTGFRLGLRVVGGEMPPPIAVEWTVRVRDLRDRIVSEGEEPWDLPDPEPFAPVVATE